MNIDRLLRKHAYRTGSFTLASGQTSNEYLDVKNALLHPQAREQVAGAVFLRLSDAISEDITAIAGIAVGAVPLATLVAKLVYRPALTVRPAAKDHGTRSTVDGLDNLPPGPQAIVLVEDVFTTGNSTIAAIKALYDKTSWTPICVIGVVDREQGGIMAIKKALPFGTHVSAITTISAVRCATLEEI